jgi:hypothetical protein
MISFNTWRFTAILGTVAMLGTTGILSLATVTIMDLRYNPPEQSEELETPLTNKQVVAAPTGAEPGASIFDWNNDLDWLSQRQATTQAFAADSKIFRADQRPDLPVPVPPISRSEPQSQQVQSTVPQVAAPQGAAPQVTAAVAAPQALVPQLLAEPRRHIVRAPQPEPTRAVTARPHKLAARPSYVEKIVEQGDAGEVKFRYLHHVCAPPHMVDVCFMPPENRRGIVVQRW